MYCPWVLIMRWFVKVVYVAVDTQREPLKISKAPHSRPWLLATRICMTSWVYCGTLAVQAMAAQLMCWEPPSNVVCQLPLGGVVEPMTTVPEGEAERTNNSL